MVALAPPPVRIIISSGPPGWLTSLVTFLVGAATALAAQLVIQIYIVPKVEKRKRREDRWERDVRELGELLTTSLTSLASELRVAQLLYREAKYEASDRYDPARVSRRARDAEQAMFAYGSLIGTQVDWLLGWVIPPSPKAQEIVQLQRSAQDYRMRATAVRVLPEHDNRTDTDFHDQWEKESTSREALIRQVLQVADLTPPRRSRRRRPIGDGKDLLGGPDSG